MSKSSQQVLDNTNIDLNEMIDNNNKNSDDKTSKIEIVVDDVMMKSSYYEKIDYHWFFTKKVQERIIWIPFSNKDSKNLESFYIKNR
jgi:hypothetical protein